MDTRTVFEDLGFKEDWQAITDQPPAYFYDFGNLLLWAVECTSGRSFKSVFLIGGIKCGPRSVGQIEFEMTLTIDSFEQGVALISHAVGKEFDPLVPTPWLSDGRKWQDHLPWVRGRARHNRDRS